MGIDARWLRPNLRPYRSLPHIPGERLDLQVSQCRIEGTVWADAVPSLVVCLGSSGQDLLLPKKRVWPEFLSSKTFTLPRPPSNSHPRQSYIPCPRSL